MKSALSIIELIVVVLIIGIIAAIAVPQLSQAAGDDEKDDLRQNLNAMRFAVELYYYEHGEYPGQLGDGINAAGTAEAVISQLTGITDENGHVSAERDAQHHLGPYLRLGMPPCPVAPRLGRTGLCVVDGAPRFAPSATEAGWVYNCRTGDVAFNSDVTDAAGTRYDEY
ncbi:MAG: hypothetical protein PVJ57_01260 [Phycisphaerae bacterium]|jgi:general secretion pathway protein G